MILPISLRESHPNDKIIINWLENLSKGDVSRIVREILLSHIQRNLHSIESDIGKHPVADKNTKPLEMKRVDVVGRDREKVDLNSKLDSLGGGIF